MARYTVENNATEQRSEHKTWGGAFRAVDQQINAGADKGDLVIIERDRDGERTYNTAGQVMSRDGHFPRESKGGA